MDDAKKDEPAAGKVEPAKVEPAKGDAGKGDQLALPPGATPPAGPAPEPIPAALGAGGIDVRLVGLCILLWVVAVGIFFSGWGDTKKDYYWGNIRQALEQPMGGYVDMESVTALAALGDDVIPSCEHELRTQPDPLFKCAVLRVLERVPGPKSRALIAFATQQDPDARVRANGLLILRDRASKAPDEKGPLAEVARERVQHETELAAKAIAAVIAGQAGDSSPEVKSLLVHALRIAPIRKDAWDCLKASSPTIPPVDAPREDGALRQVMAVEDWAEKSPLEGGGGIAILGSKLAMLGRDGKPLPPGSVAPVATPSTSAPGH